MIRHFSPYDAVAEEYYDPDLHPTCANFRALGREFLGDLLKNDRFREVVEHQPVLETGCGKSMVAETLDEGIFGFPSHLILQDDSAEMIKHSKGWSNRIADIFVSDARKMPQSLNDIKVVFSFLADPYNDAALWEEVSRVLSDGGLWVLTVPADTWARSFRHHQSEKLSRFLTINGSFVDLPSLTYQPQSLIGGVQSSNLHLRRFISYTTDYLKGHVSKKLYVNDGIDSVLDCYLFQKPRSF